MAFVNEFSWSASKDKVFKICKRKYYYDSYGFSWDNNPNNPREMYKLKKLRSIPLWIGSLVRENIRSILESIQKGKQLSMEESLQKLESDFNSSFKESENKLNEQNAKNYLGLREHEYGLLIDEDDLMERLNLAKNCIKNFYESKLFQEIKKTNPQTWLLREKSHFPHFYFEGTKVYCMYDLAIPGQGSLTVYDWTIGKELEEEEEVDRKNMLVEYFSKKRRLNYDEIHIKKIYLKNNLIETTTLTLEDINKTENYIRKSISEIKDLLDDPKANTATEEKFERTTVESNCNFCNYKKHCFPDSISEFRGHG